MEAYCRFGYFVASKIAPLLKQQLDSSDPRKAIAVEVRIKPPLGTAERAAIHGLGLSIGSETANIVTCRGNASAVAALENLDFVVSIDSGTIGFS